MSSAAIEPEMVEVCITATERIDHRRTLKIPRAALKEYEAMVERHQKHRVSDNEWEAAFGDYLIGVPGYEGSSRGLEDLTIDAIARCSK